MTPGTQTRELDLHLSVNPASPLFARLAEALIWNGELSRAERLCEKGLELYPSYPTGRLIYARCLAARGRYDGALAALGEVLTCYPGNIALWQLQEDWRELAGQGHDEVPDDAAQFTDLPTPVAVVTEAPETAEVAVVVVEAPSDPQDASPALVPETGIEAEPNPVDTPATDYRVDQILSGAEVAAPMMVPSIHNRPVPLLQPVPLSWKPGGFIQANRIVSRTLAEIYASQGAIGEAVETYRLLLDKMPERREMLEGRLRELEDRLRSEAGGRRTGLE